MEKKDDKWKKKMINGKNMNMALGDNRK